MEDLARWLGEQFNIDAARAMGAAEEDGPAWRYDGRVVVTRRDGDLVAVGSLDFMELERGKHIAEHDPARVLREIDAKRQLLALHVPTPHEDEGDPWPGCSTCSWRDEMDDLRVRYPCPTVRLLALPYAGRPGYLDAWRP